MAKYTPIEICNAFLFKEKLGWKTYNLSATKLHLLIYLLHIQSLGEYGHAFVNESPVPAKVGPIYPSLDLALPGNGLRVVRNYISQTTAQYDVRVPKSPPTHDARFWSTLTNIFIQHRKQSVEKLLDFVKTSGSPWALGRKMGWTYIGDAAIREYYGNAFRPILLPHEIEEHRPPQSSLGVHKTHPKKEQAVAA